MFPLTPCSLTIIGCGRRGFTGQTVTTSALFTRPSRWKSMQTVRTFISTLRSSPVPNKQFTPSSSPNPSSTRRSSSLLLVVFPAAFRRMVTTKVGKAAADAVSEPLCDSVKVTVEKAASNGSKRSELRRVFSLARPEAPKLTGAILLLLCSSAVTMTVPFALGRVIDLIYSSDKAEMRKKINVLCGTLFGVFLVGAACNFGRVYLMNISGQRITKNLREKVFRAIMTQEVAFFDKNKTGELVNRLAVDTSIVGNCVTNNISDGLRSTVMVGVGLSMMTYLSPKLTLISLCVVPPIAAVSIVYGRFIKKLSAKVQDALAAATEVANERISNIRTVKTFSKEEVEIASYASKMNQVLSLAQKESWANGLFFGMAGLSGNAIALIVLYSGGIMVSDQNLTVGALSSFLIYAAYIGFSIGGLSIFYSELNKGLGASTRLWQIIERQPAIPYIGGAKPTTQPRGEVVFTDISFFYPTRPEKQILQALNLKLEPGTVTAIVGHSGSGKSTLGLLLLGLYRPQSGSVVVDGYAVSQLDLNWLRNNIGTVGQEPVLFSGSIRDNVAYGTAVGVSVTDQAILEALKEANAYNFVTQDLPQGLDTLVGERGIMLSGGQKQRIAIARALIKNPKIIIMDEATSALDAESEHLVHEAMERIQLGRTVMTIAHRLSTIKNADQIAVLDNGQIGELGTYDELMSSDKGLFRNLVKHQTFAVD